MTWRRGMERDAVALAFPEWEWRDDDEVELRVDHNRGGGYSDYEWWPTSTEIYVSVRRANDWVWATRRYREYRDEEAGRFFDALMERGSR